MNNRFAKSSIIVGLLLLSFWAAKYALADFYYQKAIVAFDSLDIEQLSYARELNPVMADVDRALILRPNAADTLDLKANLLYQSWWLSPDAQYLQDSHQLQQAVRLHEKALQFRQGWAFSTARLALIYSHQSVLDDRFDNWFQRAHQLGLYETDIARSLMHVGLRNWQNLTPSQRAVTMDFVRTSIEQKANSANMMISILDGYQKRQVVCDSLANTPRKLKVCEYLN